MDKSVLQSQYESGTIGKQGLGQLRRLTLQNILDEILTLKDEDAKGWLDKGHSKLDRTKLAEAVGYETKSVNLRQSFKEIIEVAEEKLSQRKIIVNEAKTNIEVRDENVINFLAFMNERLANPKYEWPINKNNRLFHRRIWSYFLDQKIEEVKSVPAFFRSTEVKQLFADIDVKIANNEVNTLSYASEAALDEMLDSMTSAAVSKLSQQLKETKERLASEREEKKSLETENHTLKAELERYKARDQSMINSSLSSIKIAGAH
jgi:hypothetical protein